MMLSRAATRVLAVLALSLALAGCGSGGSPTPAPAAVTQAPSAGLVGSVESSDPSWIVTDTDGAGTAEGEIQLDRADGAVAKVNWRKADQYDSYVEDRSDVSNAETIPVLADDGLMFTYSADDRTVIRPAEGDAFLEIRVEGTDLAGFQAFLGSLRVVEQP